MELIAAPQETQAELSNRVCASACGTRRLPTVARPSRAAKGRHPKHPSPQQKKSATALAWNVHALCERYGINRIGFLTLTFAEHITCAKESQRRYNSLRSGVLADHYPAAIRVLERQKSGRIHYHLLVVLPVDIRTGFDFKAAEKRDYQSACPELKQEWAFWRATANKYGFGRVELLPICDCSIRWQVHLQAHRAARGTGSRLATGGLIREGANNEHPLFLAHEGWRGMAAKGWCLRRHHR